MSGAGDHNRALNASKPPGERRRDRALVAEVQALIRAAGGGHHPDLVADIIQNALRLLSEVEDRGDVRVIQSAVRELRQAFRVFAPYATKRKVTIFGSARLDRARPEYQAAVELGRRLAAAGFMVITGAGPGIMHAGHEGAGPQMSFGANIRLPWEQSANPVIGKDSKLITFKYFFTRKLMFQKEANAIALFPGGFGTHDEGFEVLTLAQTGKSDPKPIVCLQTPGCNYWHRWHAFIQDDLLGRGLINHEDLSLFRIVESEDEAVNEIQTFYRRYHSLRFVGRQLAMRLQHPISDQQVTAIQEQFSDLLSEGTFLQRGALPEELDEPALSELPRLVFSFNRRSAGRLRQLIDHLNTLP